MRDKFLDEWHGPKDKVMRCYAVQTKWQSEWCFVSDGQNLLYEEAVEMAEDIQRNGGQVRIVRVQE